jgi:GDP-fucose transporter C1
VARSLTICFTILFTKTILNTDTSTLAISASGIVMLGFILGKFFVCRSFGINILVCFFKKMLGSVSEVNFSMLGVVFGVLSSMFVSLYGIYVKKVMAAVDNDNWYVFFFFFFCFHIEQI